MSPREAYPLLRDEAEHDRLEAQARFWSDDAAALIASAGIAGGWEVADLGCGTAEVAHLLASRVGPLGRVRALDNDAALVRRLNRDAAFTSRIGVLIEEGDGYETGWESSRLDAAHARFLAAPAGRLDALVEEMKRIVRPGGVVLLQEPDGDSWDVPDSGDAWPRLRDLIRTGFVCRGGDFDAGRQLASTMTRHGLLRVEERRVTRRIAATHPYAALPLAFAQQLRDLWLQEHLIQRDELELVLNRIRQALERDAWVTTFTLVQTWGRLPD